MVNSLLLMGSCVNSKKISGLVYLILIINIIIIQMGKVNIGFFISNIIIFTLISIVGRSINNNKLNCIFSAASILIWSVLVDIVCFIMFPVFNTNLNIVSYILNGIIFNLKNVLINMTVLILAKILLNFFERILIKNYSELKKNKIVCSIK